MPSDPITIGLNQIFTFDNVAITVLTVSWLLAMVDRWRLLKGLLDQKDVLIAFKEQLIILNERLGKHHDD